MRAALLLAVLALASGCTSTTHVVSRTDAAALASVDTALRGRRVAVRLVSGEETNGDLRFVRLDSTAWDEPDRRRAVETAGVSSLVVDSRTQSLRRGALIGVGVGLTVGVLAVAAAVPEWGSLGSDVLLGIGLVSVPVGAFYGVLGGAVLGRHNEYVLIDGAGETPAPSPGRRR